MLEAFGDVRLSDLRTGEIAAWEATLPPRFRHDVVRALRMVLDAAVAWEYLPKNPAKATGKNPSPAVVESVVLEPAEVERRPPYNAAVLVGAWCYLRPGELLGLERGDVGDGELNVRGTKTARSRRTVPLPLRVAQALSELPPRLSTRLLFPSPQGVAYGVGNRRRREFDWGPRGGRIAGRRHPVHAPSLGDLLGAARWHPGERRRPVRGDVGDDAGDPLPPLALTSVEAARARLDASAASAHSQREATRR
jgi:integrase